MADNTFSIGDAASIGKKIRDLLGSIISFPREIVSARRSYNDERNALRLSLLIDEINEVRYGRGTIYSYLETSSARKAIGGRSRLFYDDREFHQSISEHVAKIAAFNRVLDRMGHFAPDAMSKVRVLNDYLIVLYSMMRHGHDSMCDDEWDECVSAMREANKAYEGLADELRKIGLRPTNMHRPTIE